ncbi:hypothetical protein [Rubellicoccus peritrichatus]|uniref:PEP-CTERM protein-sorting domain-containing protein n=1 Tax=Rubellicoccus peritrichatus TaxID=3080537 RepID=A0AAQ3L573_9BACT|nr:hypothetical protein [Puniceicoccus sp. CR14]WOO39614.1 hypothetical protein RZN69_13400 [Puniceicoccus sp. CR14]
MINIKTLLAYSIFPALMFSSASAQTTFFSQTAGSANPASGASWNTAANGSGSNGNSGTYNAGTNNLVFQTGVSIATSRSTVGFDFNAVSYQLDGGALRNLINEIGTFSGGDITVTSNGGTFHQAASVGAGNAGGGVAGPSSLVLGSNTVFLGSASSGASGVYDFGLNVNGDGTLDLGFSNAATSFAFSNLSSDFSGTVLGDTFNGSISFAAGNGALSTNVVIGRALNDRFGKLDLVGDFSVASLSIDGENIATGIYTQSDLVAINATYADNLIDNGGRVFVATSIPEPSHVGILLCFTAALVVIARKRVRS